MCKPNKLKPLGKESRALPDESRPLCMEIEAVGAENALKNMFMLKIIITFLKNVKQNFENLRDFVWKIV